MACKEPLMHLLTQQEFMPYARSCGPVTTDGKDRQPSPYAKHLLEKAFKWLLLWLMLWLQSYRRVTWNSGSKKGDSRNSERCPWSGCHALCTCVACHCSVQNHHAAPCLLSRLLKGVWACGFLRAKTLKPDHQAIVCLSWGWEVATKLTWISDFHPGSHLDYIGFDSQV